MAAEWESAPLGDLVEEILDRRGVTPLKLGSDFVPAGHRVVSAKLIKERRVDLSADDPRFVDDVTYQKWMKTPLFPDDVIMTSEAPLGELAYVRENLEWCLGQRLFGIRTLKNRLFGRFLFYALQSDAVRIELHSRATGTTVIGVRQSELRRVQIPTPPLHVQQAIAHILGTLDDKIELNRRMNETLESMARALFKSWFVDFDPVRAKSEGRTPPGMDAATASLFPSEFVDSDLGPIPKGWAVSTLASHAELNPESWNKADYPSSIRYVDLAGTKWGRIGSTAFLERAAAPSRAQRILRRGDTIVGTVRPGNGSYALVGFDGLTGSTGFAVLRPRGSETRTFVYLASTASQNIERLAHLADGGAYPAVRADVVIQTAAVSPPTAVLARFEERIGPLLDRVACNHREDESLSALRDELLPRLLSGELVLPSAEREIGATA